MTLQDQAKLSYYRKIADISMHSNVWLVQHIESKNIYVYKELDVYTKPVYDFLSSCGSEYFPKIYECIEADGKLYLIEEYIQGESLSKHMEERGTFCLSEAKSVILQICEALRELHTQPRPIIHKDLTPGNIMITEYGKVKIVDFNTARYYDENAGIDTVVIGTKKFAAPEQYGFQQTDVRTDMYTLGVLFHYLLTGDVPSVKIYKGEAEHIIRKCTQFEPSKRYQNINKLIRDIQRLPQNSPAGLKKPRGTGKDSQWIFSYLPPGFRTGRLWKMILAFVGYVLIVWVGLTMKIEDSQGIPITGVVLAVNRIICTVVPIMVIFFWTDYGRMHRIMPLMCSERWKRCGYCLYTVLIIMVSVLVLYFFGL